MKTALIPAAVALACCAATAQTPPPVRTDASAPVVNPDRNLEAARSYSASPALDAVRPASTPAPAALGRVNGSASRDWSLHDLG